MTKLPQISYPTKEVQQVSQASKKLQGIEITLMMPVSRPKKAKKAKRKTH